MGRERNSDALKPEIKKIRLGELESFFNSELYRQFSTVPITPSRVVSYIRNPDGRQEDVVLLLALIGGKLVAFRSLFAGVVHFENSELRFGWCSGSWVEQKFRRKGLSWLLLKEAYNDWNGRLMLTNYSPETENLYLKTGWFTPVYRFEGVRAYLFPKAGKLVPKAKKIPVVKIFLPVIDSCLGMYSRIKIKLYKYRKPEDIFFELLEKPDDECLKFIGHFKRDYLFNRKAEEINWILNSPWISELNRPYKKNYPFSACSVSFYYQTVKVIHRNVLEGVCMFSVREGHLKTLFFWVPSHLENDLAHYLKDFAIKNRLEMLTIYNKGIAGQLAGNKFPFLHQKKIGQKVYSSFYAGNTEKYLIQDGDGDRAFT